MAPQIISYWVNVKIWMIFWQGTILTPLRGSVIIAHLFRNEPHMPSKASERKTASVSHLRLVVLGEGDEKLNTSSPFSLPVLTAYPRPEGQVITSGFVEKFMLGGLPRIKCQNHWENFIQLEAQRPGDPSLCGADSALGAQVILQILQIAQRSRDCTGEGNRDNNESHHTGACPVWPDCAHVQSRE